MSDDLILYTNPRSRGRVARWMLEEVGEPYRAEILTYDGAMKTPAYLAVNPMGKVPALKHGNTVVTENAAICAYLADAFPQAGLAPPLAERGPYYRLAVLRGRTARTGGHQQGDGRRRAQGARADDGLRDLRDRDGCAGPAPVRHGVLAGGRFSAADLYLGSHLAFGMQFGTVETRPAFERYVERLTSRPAAIRAREIDDKGMAETPQPGQV